MPETGVTVWHLVTMSPMGPVTASWKTSFPPGFRDASFHTTPVRSVGETHVAAGLLGGGFSPGCFATATVTEMAESAAKDGLAASWMERMAPPDLGCVLTWSLEKKGKKKKVDIMGGGGGDSGRYRVCISLPERHRLHLGFETVAQEWKIFASLCIVTATALERRHSRDRRRWYALKVLLVRTGLGRPHRDGRVRLHVRDLVKRCN